MRLIDHADKPVTVVLQPGTFNMLRAQYEILSGDHARVPTNAMLDYVLRRWWDVCTGLVSPDDACAPDTQQDTER